MDNRTYQKNPADPAGTDDLMSLLRNYHEAKSRFDCACRNASVALAERENALGELEKLSEFVTQIVRGGMFDPTTPQPPQAKPNCPIPQVAGSRAY